MTVKLLDWAKREVNVDVGNIDDIESMHMSVVTGDEILTVIYKDYTEKKFDSSNDRWANFYDGEYDVYNATTGLKLFDMDEFVNRKRSYWFYNHDLEGS